MLTARVQAARSPEAASADRNEAIVFPDAQAS
jgi:hypothetical protein